jgi:hypothetical protein
MILKNANISGKMIILLCLVRHAQRRKRRAELFFSYCVSIRCRGNVSTSRYLATEGAETDAQTDEKDL